MKNRVTEETSAFVLFNKFNLDLEIERKMKIYFLFNAVIENC